MTTKSIVLLGGPDSGKTNYIGRLWPSFKKRKGILRADKLPEDIAYVDGAVEHLMKGSFAPRSDRNIEVGRADFSIGVRGNHGQGELTNLMVPDISGELWTRTVATFEITQEWLDVLKNAEGAVIFVRALSDQIVQPLDWVTARNILKMEADEDEQAIAGRWGSEGDDAITPDADIAERSAALGEDATRPTDSADEVELPSEPDLPTQVLLCELLRYLDIFLADRGDGGSPHVAVVVAAWDLLDPATRQGGPMRYLEREFPLFAGRLVDTGRLNLRLFGLSIVGGDLEDDQAFRQQFFDRDISEQGWVVVEEAGASRKDDDVMLPIAWAMGD